MSGEKQSVQCCIAGGGPAGMMLGLLLARAGVSVAVLEKHADFFRDFRGDTIHPSTLEVMSELGLLDAFLARPHQEVREMGAQVGDAAGLIADFTHLPTRCKFIVFMPQWDFLDFIAQAARDYLTFRLMMQTDVTGLLERDGRIVGVRAQSPQGAIEIFADLVVGADGRHSTVRSKAGFEVLDLGAPMDVLWFRLSRRSSDSEQSLGRADRGGLLIQLDRGEYWQCAFAIAKGSLDTFKARGIDSLRAEIARLAPVLADRTSEIRDWDDVKLLTVAVDRVRRWYRPGLLLIGDAAHAMSPIGGVGINLAIQDAVAAGNLLAAPLRRSVVSEADLAAVQKRREFPTRITQAGQVFIQNRFIRGLLVGAGPIKVPLVVRALQRCAWLRRLPARLVGLGIRPEHINNI